MIEDISNRLLRDFGNCLQETLAQDSPEAAAAPAATPEAEAAGAVAAAAPAGAAGAAPATPVAGHPAAAPAAPAKPVNGLSLFFSVLLERIKRLFGRG